MTDSSPSRVSRPSTFVAKVSQRGADMPGLMRYLYGPGRANTHTEPRLIAGSADLRFAFSGELSQGEATQLGRVLEASWREQVAEANLMAGIGAGGISRDTLFAPGRPFIADGDGQPGQPRQPDEPSQADEHGQESGGGEGHGAEADVDARGVVSDAERAHVYHLIVSLPAGNAWTDEEFATVATEYVQRMAFSTGEDDDLGCRWVAVRHGLSSNGNDHIHVAVNLVREDGRRARVPRYDYQRVQEIRTELERELPFVRPLHDPELAPVRSAPAYTMAEHRRAVDEGALAPDRVLLQQHLRAALAASMTEADWIERAVDAPGVELNVTRWQPGGRDVAVGYSARIGTGQWFKASGLAPDLTLAKMRPRWEPNETAQTRAHAAALWRDDTPLDPWPPVTRATPHLDAAEASLSRWADAVVDDVGTDAGAAEPWQQVDRDLADITSVLSAGAAIGAGTAGDRTAYDDARALVRAAQIASQRALPVRGGLGGVTPPGARRASSGPTSVQLAARHLQLALRAGGVASHPGWVAVLQQVARVARAAESARAARAELAAAHQLAAVAVTVDATAQRVDVAYGGDAANQREAWAARETAALTPRTAGFPRPSDPRGPARTTPAPARDQHERRRGRGY